MENPTKHYISKQEIEYIKRSLLEQISLRVLSRIPGISMKWLQNYVNKFYRSISFETSSLTSCFNGLILECDELWSFVCSKENTVYLWLALNRNMKKILAFIWVIGQEKMLSNSGSQYPKNIEKVQRFIQTFGSLIRMSCRQKHHPSGKETGETSHIERFNNNLRQRCSKLLRKCLSFSKDFFNHESAILYFINHYNEDLRLALS
ncbi:IS1 family transposase [Synechocystis sp. LEGE 06083]|uniref:IS1 family transposase n=1 Tax=Synechocystis sp. LEGE 06083 TaxID=915336 RepID=UPI0018827028|nr:IS1 family transposase [Synechocystis sp. LEGE 06083]